MLSRFDKVYATFQPKNIETLKPESVPWVGIRCIWEAMWVIEKDNGNSAYIGQWAMSPYILDMDDLPPFAWVPEEDLVDLEKVKDG